MYCPTHFEEQRPEVLQSLIAGHPLATIVRHGQDGLTADHVPLLHAPALNGPGHLIGHVARANPLWQVAPDEELLLVFQGPQTYISPNWYATKADGGKVVPTWNYIVVHVHAKLSPIHEPNAVLNILTQPRHSTSPLNPTHGRSPTHPPSSRKSCWGRSWVCASRSGACRANGRSARASRQ